MQKLIFSLVLIAASLAVFGGLRHAGYVWSDPKEILAVESSDPAIAEAAKAWRLVPGERFEPVATTVWALAKATPSGRVGEPRTFHMISLGAHIISAVLVFLILALVTQSNAGSFVGALLFAVHPLQVEPVAYISDFKFVVGGALALFAIWQYLAFAVSTRDSRRRSSIRHVYFGTMGFVLAVLATPVAVITPLMALILEKLLPRRSSLLAGRGPVWPLALWGLIAIFPMIWAINAQNTAALSTEVPFWSRPIVAADALSFYLSKIFVPVLIGPDYGRSPSYIMANWWGFLTWIIPALLFLVLSYWRSKARAWYGSALLLLAVAILPVSGLILFEAQATSTVANPFVYLAMLAPAMAAAYAVAMPKRSWVSALTTLAVIGSAFVSRINVGHWLDDEALWRHAVQVNPSSPIAHATLGDSFRKRGDWENAADHYRKALEVNAVSPEIHFYLGEIEREHGNIKTAVELYEKTLALDPNYAEAYGRLGLAYLKLENHEQALKYFEKAVELAPDSEEPQRFLGMLYERKGENAQAIPYLTKALKLGENADGSVLAETHALLGLALARTNQPEVAQEHLEKSLKLDPKNNAAHRTLADIYFAKHEYTQARPHYEHALETVKDDASLYMNLGTILAENRDHDKATKLFTKALEIKKDWPEAINSLGVSEFRLRQFTEAEASFKRALELKPNMADPHYYLGDIARWRGKESEALAQYYMALKFDPNHLDANYRLGNHFMKEAKPTQAIHHFQAALKAAPEDARLIYSLKKAERAQHGGDETF